MRDLGDEGDGRDIKASASMLQGERLDASGFRVQDAGFGVQDAGRRVQGAGRLDAPIAVLAQRITGRRVRRDPRT